MKLSTRFSAFFLAALALVLAGFSCTLYLLASHHFYEQLDERINAALDTLEGSIDVEQGGLEWEPLERRILIGSDPDPRSVRWAVLTLPGERIDQSANLPPADFANWRPISWPSNPPDATAFGSSGRWRMGARRLLLEQLLQLGRGHAEDDGPENDIEYPAMIMLAGLDRDPVLADLRFLALTLAGTSLSLWLICAALGYWLSRRALAPVARMAEDVGKIQVTDQRQVIPLPGTADELQELALAFNELLGRVHEAVERRDRFAGNASHQLRTPIAGLLAQIELLRRRPRTCEEYLAGLDELHAEALRMRQIVESLMFLARSDANALPVELERIDLASWLPRQMDRWSTHERAGDLSYLAPDHECTVQAHEGLLSELFDILTDNAVKYSRPGQRIAWRVDSSQSDTHLIIQDQGIGMSADERAHVFEPFYRSTTGRDNNHRGIGLGLTIAERIVNASNASISVSSGLGSGTKFVIRFQSQRG